MTKGDAIRQRRLESLEPEFGLFLRRVLKECAAGRWGLFGQNNHLDESKYLQWPEAEHLKEMAREIRSIREDSGKQNREVELFLQYCSLRGANVAGEPKLAKSLLAELDAGGSKFSR